MTRGRIVGLFLMLWATLAGVRAGGADITLAEVAGEKWLKVKLGELTVITDASESKLREWAAETTWFRNGLQSVLPLPPDHKGEPATVFLFKSDRAMRRYLPDLGQPLRLLDGIFSSAAGQNVAMLGLSGSRFEVRAKLFHEMTHWHLADSGVDVPMWFHEGLAQVFQEFTLQGDGFRIGHDQPELLHHVKIAGTPPVTPLLQQAALDYTRAGWKHGKTDLFYAQSWALAHMLLFGSKEGNLDSARHYLNALRTGLTGADAFARGFGITPEVARDRLDVYVRVPSWRYITRSLDRSVRGESFEVTALMPVEVYQHFGALLLAMGRLDSAAPFIAYACATDSNASRNWELAGVLAMSRGSAERTVADEALEKARSRASRNPWVYLMLGWRTLEGLEQAPGMSGSPLAEMRLQEAGKFFLEAARLRPTFKPAIEGLASVVLSSASPSPEFREAVRTGGTAASGSSLVQMAMAGDEIRSGQPALAARRLQQLLERQAELPPAQVARIREMLAVAQPAR